MHFWSGVSAVAGALRRRVWIDQFYFQWIPNFYIILVAPPGIVAKSTTADVAHDILRDVPGITFGPNIVTWQAIPPAFLAAAEQFQYQGSFLPQSPITCTASELGNLLDPKDRNLVDLLVTLWDNRKGLDKVTKLSGCENVVNPWINLEGCTTPRWLRENVPPGVVGGGLTSRMIFVYANKKARLVSLPADEIPRDQKETRAKLTEDLIQISELVGEYEIVPSAKGWIKKWYEKLWSGYDQDEEEVYGNYIARKQTHMMKLSMVISAATRGDYEVRVEDLELSNIMLQDTERDMPELFSWLGQSDASLAAQRLIQMVKRKGIISYENAYRFVHGYFPDLRDFEGVLQGAIRSGYFKLLNKGGEFYLATPEAFPGISPAESPASPNNPSPPAPTPPDTSAHTTPEGLGGS